jgi:hypothetical protein
MLLSLVAVDAHAQQTIFVDQDALGRADGSSWADAFVFLQDGLAVAQAGDEIWVAEGIYHPDPGGGSTAGDRDISFMLLGGIGLYGGFSGSETDRGEADWDLHSTVLSGDPSC